MNSIKTITRFFVFCLLTAGALFVSPLSKVSTSMAGASIPDGFIAELFAFNIGVEDFAFDGNGALWVGAGTPGEVTEIEFDQNTQLPIDGSSLSPAVIGLDEVFGIAFDLSGDLYLPEFCNGKVAKISNSLLGGPFPVDASLIPPLVTGLGCTDGAAFAPPGSPFSTNLFIGDVFEGGVWEIDPDTGSIIAFYPFGTDIEEVIFSDDGETMITISPGSGNVLTMQRGTTPEVLSSGFDFPDAIAQGPGNEFGSYLYIGDLTGSLLFRVDPITGEKSVFADLGSAFPGFAGFEDIIFDDMGRMYILGFGESGQIIRISPVLEVDIDIKPESDPNSINCYAEDEVITVAVLTTENFDAVTVDHATATFEGASEIHVDRKTGEPRRHEEDVDGDGDVDLVFHFRLGDTDLTCDSLEGSLVGKTFDGLPFEGTDSLRMIGEPRLFATGLWGPFGMAFDADQNLFVANEGDGGGGTFVSRVTPAGKVSTFASGFDGAAGVDFDSGGILYVSDDTNRVYRVSESGNLSVFIDESAGLSNPNAIAFDSEDNLYVVSTGGFVSKFDPSGTLINLDVASGFNTPQAIVVDDEANLLFISDIEGRIFQIEKDTGNTNLYADASVITDGGLAMDKEANLYLSAWNEGLVLRIDALDQGISTCLSGLITPRGLIFDSAGRLYVTSYQTGEIFRANSCEP